MQTRQLVIIGGGPGGYVAAIRAAQLGAKVTLVEKDLLGGTCLNRGCIPTKALYQAAKTLDAVKQADMHGIEIPSWSFNLAKTQQRKVKVVEQLRNGVIQLLKANGVEVIKGTARLASSNTVVVETEEGSLTFAAEKILLAAGSLPTKLPVPGANLPGVLTSREALEFESLPQSMIIVGGGVIGMEFASIFSSFGTKVTVIEYMTRVLMQVDKEISIRLSGALRKSGVNIITNTKVNRVESKDGKLCVIAEGQQGDIEVMAEVVLMSAGRIPWVEGLGLDEAGVEYSRRGIAVGTDFRTNVQGIYAIGDVTGGMMLAHVASDQGKVAVEGMFGQAGHYDPRAVPSAIFTFPEIAMVGYTEEEAKQLGIPLLVGKFPLGANSKANIMGEEAGLVKLVARQDNRQVIGMHIMGAHAPDLIHEGALAITNKLTIDQVAQTIHAHPTLSEAVHEAALAADNRAIHVVGRKS